MLSTCGEFTPNKTAEKFHTRICRQFFDDFLYTFTHVYKLNEPWVLKGGAGVKKVLTAHTGARFADSVKLKVDAAVDSATENQKLNLENAQGKLKDQQKRVKSSERKLKVIEKDVRKFERAVTKSKLLNFDIFLRFKWEQEVLAKKLKEKLHNQRARLQKLTQNVERYERKIDEDDISICFGTKELFHKQFNLDENG